MTHPDLDLLLSLVDKATPGPWKAITPPWQRGWVHGPNSVEVADCFDAQNARYLAALDPETVRSLIQDAKIGRLAREVRSARVYAAPGVAPVTTNAEAR